MFVMFSCDLNMNHFLDLLNENAWTLVAYASFGYKYTWIFKIFCWFPKVEMPAIKNEKMRWEESKIMSVMRFTLNI